MKKTKLQKDVEKIYDNYVTFLKHTNNTEYDFRMSSYKNKYKYENMHGIYENPKSKAFVKIKLPYEEAGRAVGPRKSKHRVSIKAIMFYHFC